MFPRVGPLKFAIVYTVFGTLWIVGSDAVVNWVFPESFVAQVQTLKGIAFVGATAILVYWMVWFAQRSISSSEARFRSVFTEAPIGATVCDGNGRFLLANKRFQEMIGYSEAELQAMHYSKLTHPEDLPTNVAHFTELTAGTRDQYHSERRYVRRDGSCFWASVSVSAVRDGSHFIQAIATVEDITERRAAAVILAESEERFRSLVEGAPFAIIIQTSSRFRYLNPAAVSLFGATRAEQLIGTPISDRFESSNRELIEGRVREVLADGKPLPLGDERLVTLDGRTIVVEATAVPFPLGGEAGALVFLRDVTTAREVQGQKAHLEEQLRQAQKMEAIGQLAGGIAHDFNNILQVIKGYSDLLLEEIPPESSDHTPVKEIGRASERASALTRQLLSFGRREFIQKTPLNLDDCIGEIAGMIGRLIGENVLVEVRTSTPPPTILGDRNMVDQVVLNLAVNARDAMPNGGTLVVQTYSVTLDADYCRSHIEAAAGPHVVLAVTDTGIGMTRELLSRIFEPFFTTKEKGKGTGLGLATVYGIAQQHGGWIEVESTPGKGSTFRVYFPTHSAEPVVDTAPSTPRPIGGTGIILLAEDEPNVSAFTARLLTSAGFQVISAADGDEAVKLFATQQHEVDLAVLDLIMPRKGGWEAALAMRKMRPNLPVLFASGYSDRVPQIDVQGLGNAVLVQKPFTRDQLLEAIHSLRPGVRKGQSRES